VLLDKGASDDEVERIAGVISKVEGVKGYHRLRARHMGSRLVVDLHIQVEGKMPLSRAHSIAHRLEKEIKERVPVVKDIVVHVEPVGDADA
jgi:divalent metal cation (Fe/Co/Zn/Cd) transporter